MIHPWGLLDWSLGLSSQKNWRFVGCLGAEERSIASYCALAQRNLLSEEILLQIEEPNSPYAARADAKIGRWRQRFSALNLNPGIFKHELLDPISTVDNLCTGQLPPSIILDITSLPKRFFFYLLKSAIKAGDVQNLIVTYTIPKSYATGALSEDVEPWDALPTFRLNNPDDEVTAHRRLVINVGFMPDGIAAHVESPDVEKKIDLIVPFPSSVTAVQRAWQSVWALTQSLQSSSVSEHRVGANDMSEAFHRIVSLLPEDSNLVSFAPFGPKPISAAMCIYSALTESPVYYAQPKAYNPDYSDGVATQNGRQEIYAYWIKHEGTCLYELPENRRP